MSDTVDPDAAMPHVAANEGVLQRLALSSTGQEMLDQDLRRFLAPGDEDIAEIVAGALRAREEGKLAKLDPADRSKARADRARELADAAKFFEDAAALGVAVTGLTPAAVYRALPTAIREAAKIMAPHAVY